MIKLEFQNKAALYHIFICKYTSTSKTSS